MNSSTGRVALLLLGSGMCALVLGAGGLVLGRRADCAPADLSRYLLDQPMQFSKGLNFVRVSQ